jgi:FG-GAP-like repeat/ASPIC and UnbV
MRSSTGKVRLLSRASTRKRILRRLASAIVAVIVLPSTLELQTSRESAALELASSGRSYRFVDITRKVGIPVTRTRSWGATFVDYDNNGWPDALVGRHLDRAWFLTNNEGMFRRRRIHDLRDPPGDRILYDRHSCAWGEANGDGRLDLYCVSGAQRGRGTGPNQLLIQRRNGDLVNRTNRYGLTDLYGRGRSVNWLDFNRDGRLDIFVGNENRPSHPNVMFKRVGRRHYVRARVGVGAELATKSSSWADWNRDGKADLLVLVSGQRGAVAYRSVGGRFKSVAMAGITGRRWLSGTWGDYNGDGWPDLAAVAEGRLVVFRNRRGSFSPAYSLRLSEGRVGAWFDAENDGDLDLFVVQGSPSNSGGNNRPDFLIVRDHRGFRPVRRRMIRGPRRGGGDSVATADYDRDGRVDLLITNGYVRARGRVQLLRNRTASGHRIAVELVGGRRNPFALGTRVHVRTDRLSYWREVTDGASFRSQSEVNPVHLGIGRAGGARLRVRWPGGAKSCLRARAGARIRVVRRGHPC